MNGNVMAPFEDENICCGVNGVRCSQDGRVLFIDWINKRLTGEIPPELGDLRDLEHLYVFYR